MIRTDHGTAQSNSDAVKGRIAHLRRLIASDKGKIERRETAILFARQDIFDARHRIRVAQDTIIELGGKVKR